VEKTRRKKKESIWKVSLLYLFKPHWNHRFCGSN